MAYDDDDVDLNELNLGPWAPKVPTIVWEKDKYRIVCHWKSVKFEQSSTDAMGQISWAPVPAGDKPKVLWLVLQEVASQHMLKVEAAKGSCAAEDVNYIDSAAGCLPAETPPSAPGSVPDDDIPF